MAGETASIFLTTNSPKPGQVWVRKDNPSAQWAGSRSSFDFNWWQTEALKGIVRLEALHENWDSEGSLPPSRVAIETAIAFIQSLPYEDLPAPFVAPTSLGGLQFEWTENQKEIEVEILPNGSLEALWAVNGQAIGEGPISVEGAQGLFKWLRPEAERLAVAFGFFDRVRQLLMQGSLKS